MDPIMNLDAAKINIFKRLLTRNRQPWMRWGEHKLIKVAQRWTVPEAMAATPSRRQLRELDATCLVESTLALWHEIGGTFLGERVRKHVQADATTATTWESGFGVHCRETWHPIESLRTKTTYAILLAKRSKLRHYTPKNAHKNIYMIKKYLTPEERHFWWKLIHRLTSIRKTECKYKRDARNKQMPATCPLCPQTEESRQHYEYDCPHLSIFRQHIANLYNRQDFTQREWMLEATQPVEVMTYIAKARWVFHCERCQIDHKSRRRFQLKVVLDRTQRRMQLLLDMSSSESDPPPPAAHARP